MKNTKPHSYVFTDPKPLREYTDEEIQELIWYTKIELRPNVFTQSFFEHKNADEQVYPISLIRHLLKNIHLQNRHKCLDFGTMNGILPVLVAKKGCKVLTQDVMSEYYGTVELVKQAYGVDFEYVYGNSIYDLKLERKKETFDLVLFCGIMYHLINPIMELAIARSFLKPGGLMIIETIARSSSKCSIDFNEVVGSVSVPSTCFLEKMCRILSLKPIDAVYIGDPANTQGRIAFICRAVTFPAIDFNNEHEKGLWWNIVGKLPFAQVNKEPIINEKMFYNNAPIEDYLDYDLSNAVNLVPESPQHNSYNLSHDAGINLTKTIQTQPNGNLFVKPKEILRLSDCW